MDEQESLWAARMIAYKQQAEKALADGARVVLELTGRVEDLELERRALAEKVADLTAERDQLKAKLDALVSKPEPAPRAGGELVTPRVLAWLDTQRVNVGDRAVDRAQELVLERDAFGRLKYEQGLSMGDGRDTVEDLRQELGDALQYAIKARAEGLGLDALEELRDLGQLLWLLFHDDALKGGV